MNLVATGARSLTLPQFLSRGVSRESRERRRKKKKLLAMAALSSFLLGPCSSSSVTASVSSSANGSSFFTAEVPFAASRVFPLLNVSRHTVARRRGDWATARAAAPTKSGGLLSDERVIKVHNIDEFEAALRAAKNKLVVVEFAETKNDESRQIYPAMVELSYTCGDVVFILVLGDESDETRKLLKREGIETVPHFNFYKTMEKIHEEEGIGPDQLMGDVLYYGDNHSLVEQLHSREDVEALMARTKEEGKMMVLDVGLKHCGPCVKVYPTVMKLSRSMKDAVVFARMNGDENESCMQFLRDMDVVEVPTFLFIQDGKISGRYVGSGKGELVGEILRYQGTFS